MAWQPQEDGLKHLSFALRDSLSAYDRVRQKQAEEVCEGSEVHAYIHQNPLVRRETDAALSLAYCPSFVCSGLCQLLDIHFRIHTT